MERDSLDFDVVIVGAGPAGLAAACRLGQLAASQGKELDICVVEKAAEVGGHIVSGAVVEPRALDELFPDWREQGAPLSTPVERDKFYWLPNARRGLAVPRPLIPRVMHKPRQPHRQPRAAFASGWVSRRRAWAVTCSLVSPR